MEDVWNDVSLASHHHRRCTTTTTTNHSSFPSTIFQDFLAQPLKRDPPTIRDASTEHSSFKDASFLGSPTTVLSLNSSSTKPQFGKHGNGISPSFLSPINVFTSSSPLFPSICNKRALEKDDHDRRLKRMMKHRESSARSRARKQAYAPELELKIAHLKEKNAELKRELEKFCCAANDQQPKRRILHRTLTAPF